MIGHLYSPGSQRGPWPWMPYALDNGAFACWDSDANTFDFGKWERTESEWKRLLVWANFNTQKALWAIVPDVPGNREATLARWATYAPLVQASSCPLAIAVQDGMTVDDVLRLKPQPKVIAVGGSTEWKWGTVEMWAANFLKVHVLRCNSPKKLKYLKSLGVESCDGTGWNRGDLNQTSGLEAYCRETSKGQTKEPLWPFASRSKEKDGFFFSSTTKPT